MDNVSLLRKADLAIADLTANGGELLPEQGASFIRKMIAQPTLIRRCRVVEMGASKRKINKIGFGTRILRKATSGVALTSGQRSSTSATSGPTSGTSRSSASAIRPARTASSRGSSLPVAP